MKKTSKTKSRLVMRPLHEAKSAMPVQADSDNYQEDEDGLDCLVSIDLTFMSSSPKLDSNIDALSEENCVYGTDTENATFVQELPFARTFTISAEIGELPSDVMLFVAERIARSAPRILADACTASPLLPNFDGRKQSEWGYIFCTVDFDTRNPAPQTRFNFCGLMYQHYKRHENTTELLESHVRIWDSDTGRDVGLDVFGDTVTKS